MMTFSRIIFTRGVMAGIGLALARMKRQPRYTRYQALQPRNFIMFVYYNMMRMLRRQMFFPPASPPQKGIELTMRGKQVWPVQNASS
jgi:hypothetical protein